MTDEYPCVSVKDVDPIFVPHMIRGAMALRYMRAVPDLTHDEAAAAAIATWGADWESDPRPRSFESAIEAVDSDLQYWND